jgi:hypothetical protein
MNQAYKIFPDSKAAKGDKDGGPGAAKESEDGKKKEDQMSTEAIAMAYLMRGVHF